MRTVSVRLWVLIVLALLVGAGIGATVIALATRVGRGGTPVTEATSATPAPTPSTKAEVVVASTSTSPSSTTTSTTRLTPASSSTTVQAPRGSIQVFGSSAGLGQGFPSGPCGNWRLKLVNISNTEIVRVVFAPPLGHYTNFREFNQQTQQHAPEIAAAKPAPAVLNISLPPYGEQILSFQTCTTTPPPANTNYEFGAAAPDTVTFTWATGQSGSAPFLR